MCFTTMAVGKKKQNIVQFRLLVEKEKNRVILAEANNDLVDILFGFLTLPIGTIVRLIRKQNPSAKLGCMSNLYSSVEELYGDNWISESSREMLLYLRNPYEAFCRRLKVNIDDTEPAKYFICSDMECSQKENGSRLLSQYAEAKCRCGKLMNRGISIIDSNAYGDKDSEGVFVQESMSYIITDDLSVTTCTPGAVLELLREFGFKSLDTLEVRDIQACSEQILNLLMRLFHSKTPLSDVFLSNHELGSFELNYQFPYGYALEGRMMSSEMRMKITVRKSDKQTLFAEANEEFVDFLFSFLTISSLPRVHNLYGSVLNLDTKWFARGSTHLSSTQEMLLYRWFSPNDSIKTRLSLTHETMKVVRFHICNKAFGEVHAYHLTSVRCSKMNQEGTVVTLLLLINETFAKELFKRPSLFFLGTQLNVARLSSFSSLLSAMLSDASFDDIEDLIIFVNNDMANRLMKACLISKSPLLDASRFHLMSMKGEK